MSPDRDMKEAASAGPDPDAEQEVDFGRYWWRIVGHWWVVAAGLILGVVIGYLVSLGGGTTYQAKATVFLGQPLTPSGNARDPEPPDESVDRLSDREEPVGCPGDRRQGGCTAGGASKRHLDEGGRRVALEGRADAARRGLGPRAVEEAVRRGGRLLARTVVERVSGYADTKIEQYTALKDSLDEQIAASDDAIQSYRDAIAAGTGLSSAERLVLVGLLQSEHSNARSSSSSGPTRSWRSRSRRMWNAARS